ncbi:tRNA dihydrouridine(20/20a) synthase DusA [Buchnera aphidicola]|uniref:tRNA dihydrouridine(20/20a) synthase DusA n=1 Tax=Buchnera aphidicola TaxID=9 RepID=UPI0031B6C041
MPAKNKYPYKFSVAPMLNYTDFYCHFFYRQLTQKTLLYTEMYTTKQIIHQFINTNIKIYPPTSLQLAGNNIKEFIICAKWAEKIGFNEININLGCPSKSAQKGNFGICLMNQPEIVFKIIQELYYTISLPISVKIRLGITKKNNFYFLKNFIQEISKKKYCKRFVIHARNADLTLTKTYQNRNIPPLNYSYVYKIKKYFPKLIIILNGGLQNINNDIKHLKKLDGIMMGRKIYKNPLILTKIDKIIFNQKKKYNILKILRKTIQYAEKKMKKGIHPFKIIKHFLNTFSGISNSKKWKKYLLTELKNTKNLTRTLNDSFKLFSLTDLNSFKKF